MSAPSAGQRAIVLDAHDVEGILDSLDALASVFAMARSTLSGAAFVIAFNQELRAKHDLAEPMDLVEAGVL